MPGAAWISTELAGGPPLMSTKSMPMAATAIRASSSHATGILLSSNTLIFMLLRWLPGVQQHQGVGLQIDYQVACIALEPGLHGRIPAFRGVIVCGVK